MFVLGLTGSIGMGKTTAAKVFGFLGVPVHDADGAVHDLLGLNGAAVAGIEAAFPGVAGAQGIDHANLASRVFTDRNALKRLEAILHPLVRAEQNRFLRRMARRRRRLVVLDVPLLFESGAEILCDAVIVVSAPTRIQEERVLARPGMTRHRLAGILLRQLDDSQKRRRADFLVPTGLGRRFSLQRIHKIVKHAKQSRGKARWKFQRP